MAVVKHEPVKVRRHGVRDERSFTIAETVDSFRALSDGLYSDKIRAVLRELSTNAADAHKEAGLDIPFEVELPRYGNQQFRIRDFGPGMDPEKIADQYTQYFFSDKTDDNEQTGQFGLGSKSPFCYADQFMVINRHKGQKTVYSCFVRESSEVIIDEDGNVTGGDDGGFPAIGTLEGPMDCDEPSGLEVIIPTKGSDYYSWEEAAKRVYKYFDLRPKLTYSGSDEEVEIPTVEYVYGSVEDHWGIRSGLLNGDSYVIMGNVCYPMSVKEKDNLPSHIKLFFDTSFDLYMPVGSLQMTPSREALQNTPRNRAVLLHALEQVSEKIRKTITIEIEKAPSLWDARNLMARMQSESTAFNRMSRLSNVDAIKWKDKPLSTAVLNFNGFSQEIAAFEFAVERSYSRYRRDDIPESAVKRHRRTAIAPHHNITIVENDLKRGAFTRCKRNIAQAEDGEDRRYFLVEFQTDAAREGFLNLIGGNRNHLQKVSDLPNLAPAKPKRSGGRSAKQLRWDGSWCEDEVDIDAGGLYVPVYKTDVKANGNHPWMEEWSFATTISDYKDVFNTDLEVYGFRGRIRKTITEDGIWEDAIDYIESEVRDYFDVGLMQQIRDVQAISRFHTKHYHEWFDAMCRICETYPYEGTPLEEYAKYVLRLKKIRDELGNLSRYVRLISRFDLDWEGTTVPEKSFGEVTEEMLPSYPCLQYICKYSPLVDQSLQDAVEYMLLLDSNRKEPQNVS